MWTNRGDGLMQSAAKNVPLTEPVPEERRRDPAVRRQMSGPAIRTFFNVAQAWSLTNEEQRGLLGWPPESTFFKYKGGDPGTLSFDMLTRISLALGIYKDPAYPVPRGGACGSLGEASQQQRAVRRQAGALADGQWRHGRTLPTAAGFAARRLELSEPTAP